MDTLSNFQKYTSVNPAVQKFRSWTELFIEIALAGLFTIGFVAWSQTIIEAGGLVCVPSEGDTYEYSLSESRYVNSKCQLTFGPRMLIFYPYFILINFGILLISHILWSKIPSVVTKLSTYCTLFNQISKLSPIFPKNTPSNRVLPTFDHMCHDKDKVKMLHERVIFMFLEKSYIKKIYVKKCRMLSFICLLSIFLTIMWIWLSNFGNTTYSCIIDYKNPNRTAGLYSCDASPSVYIFGVMIFHLFALFIIFGLSLYATFFSVSFKKHLDVFTSDENYDRFKGLPGVQDFVFCVSLLRTNFPDGHYTFHAVKYVLTQCKNLDMDNANKPTSDVKLILIEDDPDVIKKKERFLYRRHKFDEGVLVVHYMLYELGLREIPNKQNKSHLYDCLELIAKKFGTYHTPICNQSIREVITNELIHNRSYYKLILDMIDVLHPSEDSSTKDSSKYPFYKLERTIARIQDHNVWGDWISIAAICNVINAKILLIHAGKTHGTLSKFIIDDFSPHTTHHENCRVFFMTYLEPHYYHVADSIIESDSNGSINREKFIEHTTERKILRKLAIGNVSKNQKITADAITKPEQPETIAPHKNRRFDVTTIAQKPSQGALLYNPQHKFGTTISTSESSESSIFRPTDNKRRYLMTHLGDDIDPNKTTNYKIPKSLSKMKHHIQLTIGRMDPYIDFKQLTSNDASSSTSE